MKITGALLAVLLFAGCSEQAAIVASMSSVSVKQMQRQLNGQQPKVACPDDIEWEAGQDFHCIAMVGKQSVRVTVTMENDTDWTWTTG